MEEKVIESRACRQCQTTFDITELDADFLVKLAPTLGEKRFSLPFPTLCPTCRKVRRYAWRNEKKLYKRKCDATGKEIISLFSPLAPCPVYESKYWYSDAWDAHAYGRDFDFSKGFFEQWHELKKRVPMPGKAISKAMENSEYSDNCSNMKNCYLVFNGEGDEECLYSTDTWSCRRVVDSLSLYNCEESYELLDARDCHAVHFSHDVNTCRDSYFLADCYGCSDCYGCFGQKNQKYHIYNTPYSEAEYRRELSNILLTPVDEQKKIYEKFLKENGYNATLAKVMRSENVSDSVQVFDSKNISHSKMINDSENLRYATNFRDTRMGMDIDQWGDRLDQVYECHQVGEASSRQVFSFCNWANTSDLLYSAYCVNNVHHCFGCVGLRDAKYCILNKQYTKEAYETLVPNIIEHMRKTGEWGEFFPASFSHFGYNDTMNMIRYPLSKEEAKKNWFAWSDYEAPFPKVEKTIPGSRLPEKIEDIPDDILNWAVECEVSRKPFRITRLELDFYRRHHLPVPRKHPDIRYLERTKIYVNY